jgi:hypothetical protein
VSIKEAVGPERYAKVRQTLESCWPDDHAVVTDELVDELFLLAKHEWGSEDLKDVDLPKPTPELPKQQGRANAYYLGRATHARVAAPHSIFLGDLPLVRVALPPTGTSHTAPPIETEGGVVLPVDRLFPSIEVMWARYAPRLAHLGGCPERVDLITPPRLKGSRFGAVALYLGYRKASDRAPCFFVLEAGLGTGQPRIPFLGPTMDTVIVAQTNYRPTPFSGPHHWYRGQLSMKADAPSEPETLIVEGFRAEPPADPYIKVTVEYEKRAEPVMTNPLHLTLAAGARLTAIADALGTSIDLPLQWLMRIIAKIKRDELFITPPQQS